MFHVSIPGKGLMQMLEDALLAPAREAAVDGVPVAVLCGQQSSLRATASDPQNGREKTSAFIFLSDIDVWMRAQDGQQLLPLSVR